MDCSVNSSANSSDPEVEYEPLSLKWVQQTYGLPKPPDKSTESQQKSVKSKANKKIELELKDMSDQSQLDSILEPTADVQGYHLKRLKNMRQEFEHIKKLGRGNFKIRDLEILIKKWFLELDRITESQNLQAELLEENIRDLYQLYLKNLENEKQVVEQYRRTVVLLNKRLDRKTRIIAKLREDKMMLQQWISSTYKAISIFTKDAESSYSFGIDHVVKVSRKPSMPKIRNIQTHLLYLLQKYLSSTEKMDDE